MSQKKEEGRSVPNPGSREAQDLGCVCPIVDNDFGRGYYRIDGEAIFIYSGDCPLHGAKNPMKNKIL